VSASLPGGHAYQAAGSGGPFRPRLEGLMGGIGGASVPFPLRLTYAFWVLTTFEPDILLSSMTGAPFYRISLLFMGVLGLFVLRRRNAKTVYWPLILFVLMHFAASLLATNAGLSRDALKFMVYMLVLFAGSATFVDSPSRMLVVLKIYFLSFAWYGIQGMPGSLGGLRRGAGLTGVTWHPVLSNEDSFGPLMVMSMAFSYFFAMAVPSPRWKKFARVLFALSIVGVVVTFARGSQLAGGAVLLYLMWRSPRRAVALASLVIILIVAVPVAAMVFPLGKYMETMSSVAEGDDLRTSLWRLAWNVFLTSPVYGVGALNFGVVASQITPYDPENPLGADPAKLYLFWLHNVPFQILAEEGLAGISLWMAMIIGFFWWNRRLQSEEATARWRERGGGSFDIRMMARGLDGAMVGYLATCIFYNQLYFNHWFWSLLTLSYVLRGVTGPMPSQRAGGR
jgi:O-antigen ligase